MNGTLPACFVLSVPAGPCSRGTVGCDACSQCTCHGCYAHASEDCRCGRSG